MFGKGSTVKMLLYWTPLCCVYTQARFLLVPMFVSLLYDNKAFDGVGGCIKAEAYLHIQFLAFTTVSKQF